MDRRASCQTTSRRAVMGSTLRHLLLLLLLCASPASFTLLEEIDALTETAPLDQTTDLLRFLRSLAAYNHLKEALSSVSDLKSVEADKQQAASKRGFGIAGLDNVDMITSTLDRSRSRSRYRPQMSMNVNLSQLRALMAKAG